MRVNDEKSARAWVSQWASNSGILYEFPYEAAEKLAKDLRGLESLARASGEKFGLSEATEAVIADASGAARVLEEAIASGKESEAAENLERLNGIGKALYDAIQSKRQEAWDMLAEATRAENAWDCWDIYTLQEMGLLTDEQASFINKMIKKDCE